MPPQWLSTAEYAVTETLAEPDSCDILVVDVADPANPAVAASVQESTHWLWWPDVGRRRPGGQPDVRGDADDAGAGRPPRKRMPAARWRDAILPVL